MLHNNQTRQTCEEDEYPALPRHSELRMVEAEPKGPGEWTSEGGLNGEISQ